MQSWPYRTQRMACAIKKAVWQSAVEVWPTRSYSTPWMKVSWAWFNALLLTFVSCRQSPMGQWSTSGSRGDTHMCVCCSLTFLLHIVFAVPHEHRIPVDSWCVWVQQDSKQIQDKCFIFVYKGTLYQIAVSQS